MDYMYAQTPLKRYALLIEDKMMTGDFGHLQIMGEIHVCMAPLRKHIFLHTMYNVS